MLVTEAKKRLKDMDLRFSDLSVERRKAHMPKVEFQLNSDLTFAMLKKISDNFNSEHIEIEGGSCDYGYCSNNYLTITIYNPE